MLILGVNAVYHESAACLINNGKIIAAIEEERLNRIKHGKKARIDNPDQLPEQAIRYCLEEASKHEKRKISLGDIDSIGFSFNPQKRLDFHLHHVHPYTITNDFGEAKAEELFCEKAMSVEMKLRKQGFRGEFFFLDHHDCHAASTFFVSPFGTAAIMVIDGIGEYESTTLYHGRNNSMKKILSIDYPHSLGFLWEKFSTFLGFSEYDACKVMGLAAYGDASIYRNQFAEIVTVDNHGVFTVDDAIMKFRIEDYTEIINLFGLPKRNKPIRQVTEKTKRYADLAAALQEVTETIMIRLAKYLKEETKEKYLCLAGGVALNCAANGKLVEQNLFDDIFIQPAAHDAGTAIGAAYVIWNIILGKSRRYVQESPYLGITHSSDEIKTFLDKKGLTYTSSSEPEKAAALLIAQGNIIAWHQGRMEVGPRALGNRSILADPRQKKVRNILNHKVKFREPFRPFCPSILAEDVKDWFEGNLTNASQYMVVAHHVNEEKRKIIPAVVHEDGTSRIQIVSATINPRFHKLLVAFKKITGVPLVLNTSFNVQEPIISGPEEAVATFLKSGIDFLIIGDYLVPRKENLVPEFRKDISLQQYFEGLR